MQPLYHMLFMGSFVIPLLLLFYLVFRNHNQATGDLNYAPSSIFQMALQYAIAYNVVFFIQELFLALGKKWIGLSSYLYHNNHNWDGHDPRAALMQGSGALAILIFGLLMAGLYLIIRNREYSVWTKTMILWLSLHGMMQSLPQVTTAFVATQTDTGQALAYLGVEGSLGFTIAFISVGMIVLFSRWYFVQFANLGIFNSGSLKAQFRSVMVIIGLPLLIGSIFIIPYRIMPWDRGFNQFFNLVPWLPWFLLFSALRNPRSKRAEIQSTGLVKEITIALIILLVFQLILAPGVKF